MRKVVGPHMTNTLSSDNCHLGNVYAMTALQDPSSRPAMGSLGSQPLPGLFQHAQPISDMSSEDPIHPTNPRSTTTLQNSVVTPHVAGNQQPVPDRIIRPRWDGWPDGDFEQDFTHNEVEAIGGLTVHWTCEASGGMTGSEDAETWQEGRKLLRRCRGIIACNNECGLIIRSKVKKRDIDRQLSKDCECGGKLTRKLCGATHTLSTFKHGVHFVHKGTHNHSRPTHILHLTKDQRHEFEAIVQQSPASGPAQLLVGSRSLGGPGRPVSDISSVLVNKDRVGYELKKIRERGKPGYGVDGLSVSEFAEFDKTNPGFVVSCTLGEVSVISMQQPLMLAELVKETRIESEAVNGIVSDAAHGFWKQRNCLLVISSAYSPRLKSWIPGILSFTNGATSAHYRQHFLALFKSISRERERRNWDTSSDEPFSNVGSIFRSRSSLQPCTDHCLGC